MWFYISVPLVLILSFLGVDIYKFVYSENILYESNLCDKSRAKLGHARSIALEETLDTKGNIAFYFEILERRDQYLILLGESHLKGKELSVMGRKIVRQFKLRGIEGGSKQELEQLNRSWFTKQFIKLYSSMRDPLFGVIYPSTRIATYEDGYVAKLPDELFYKGIEVHDVQLESIEDVPSKFLDQNVPVAFGIEAGQLDSSKNSFFIDDREKRKAKNIEKILDLFPEQEFMLVIVGTGHLPGLVKILVEEKEFVSLCDRNDTQDGP